MLISMLKMQIFRQNSLIDTHFTQIRRYWLISSARIILADFNKLFGYFEIDTNVCISIRYFSINFMKLIWENIYEFVRMRCFFFCFEKFTSNFENILIIKFREFFLLSIFLSSIFLLSSFYYRIFITIKKKSFTIKLMIFIHK